MNTKVLFFASDYKIGLTILLTEELRFLVQQPGLDVMAVAGDTEQINGLSEKIKENNIPIKRIDGLDLHKNFILLAKKIHQLTIGEKYAFVHVQNNWQLALVVFVKYYYKSDYSIIYTIHGYRHNNNFKAIVAKRVIDIALRLFAHIVFAASSEVKQKFWLVRKKCFVLFLGVEESYFNLKPVDFSTKHKNLIFAGQFRPGKNQQILIEAISKYIERTGNKEVSLYLPGEGPQKEACMKLATQLHLQEHIIFTGQLARKEILQLYADCQIAIVPTNTETFGHCIAEPYVGGLCVISRKTGVALDIIADEKSGLLFDSKDELVDLLVKYLDNQNLLELLSKNAHSNRESLRWSNIINKYEKILMSNRLI